MPRPNASEQAKRLVALLGHLMTQERLPISVLAQRAGLPESQLAADLEMLSMCGVAPYDPWAMVPVMIEDGYVEVFGEMPALKGAVRLSAAEATALVAALEAAGIAADHPLANRLISAATSSFDAEQVEQILATSPSGHESAVYECVARALEEHRLVRIEYLKSGSESRSCRDIEPQAMFAERGAWYVTAWCRTASGYRTFRLDRIVSAELVPESFEPREVSGGCTAFSAEGLPFATLRFAPGTAVSDREWPGIRGLEQAPDGSTIAQVPYGGTSWIARMVMARLGRVEVISPAEVRDAVRALASETLGDLADHV